MLPPCIHIVFFQLFLLPVPSVLRRANREQLKKKTTTCGRLIAGEVDADRQTSVDERREERMEEEAEETRC